MALDVKLRDDLLVLHEIEPEQEVEFIALQPVSIVDHVCSVDEDTLKSIIEQNEIGGSRRVDQKEVQRILGVHFTSRSFWALSMKETLSISTSCRECHVLCPKRSCCWRLHHKSRRLCSQHNKG